MIKYLLGKSSNGKFRFAIVECNEEWCEPEHGYIIQRSYGQVNGKTTLSPKIIVNKTKQNRTWKEQYMLQFNSETKKFLDKGYIEVEKHPNDYSNEELNSLFGSTKKNRYGIIKPMLAKQFDKVTNKKIFNDIWIASRKLDGVRCLMYWNGDSIHTASRGGETYEYSTEHIRNDKRLINYFKDHPNNILDGELFKRFTSLQKISGAARLEKNAYDCDWLQYWIYDVYESDIPDLKADYRIKGLLKAVIEYHIPLYNDTSMDEEDSSVFILMQNNVSGLEEIDKLHDKYVSEGFEGVVIRNPEKPYKPGGRTNDMIKIKKYKSEDFKVIGYKLGLRGFEDMTFTCELKDGRTFEAMPCGDRATKAEYVKNFDNKYKGHKAECTFFNYSDKGIPTQPKMRVFRFDLEN